MFGTAYKTLREVIVTEFQKAQELSAGELIEQLKGEYSRRAVYKELSILLDANVLVKAGQKYSISSTWILELINFAEILYQNHFQDFGPKQLLPERNKKHVWKFTNLKKMDAFWLQIVFTLLESSADKVCYSWSPHFWFPLVTLENELKMIKAMELVSSKMYMIVGHDTYLDRLGTNFWDKDIYTWSYAESPFHDQMYKYIAAIDDYVLTVDYDQRIMSMINRLFLSVENKNDLDVREVNKVFDSYCSLKVQLEHHQGKSRQVKRKFIEYFD